MCWSRTNGCGAQLTTSTNLMRRNTRNTTFRKTDMVSYVIKRPVNMVRGLEMSYSNKHDKYAGIPIFFDFVCLFVFVFVFFTISSAGTTAAEAWRHSQRCLIKSRWCGLCWNCQSHLWIYLDITGMYIYNCDLSAWKRLWYYWNVTLFWDFGFDLWSRIIWSWTIRSRTIYNLEEYCKLTYAPGPYLKSILLQEYIENMLLDHKSRPKSPKSKRNKLKGWWSPFRWHGPGPWALALEDRCCILCAAT